MKEIIFKARTHSIKLFLLLGMLCLVAWSTPGCRSLPFSTQPGETPAKENAPTPTFSNPLYQRVFETVWQTVNDTYFDPGFGGLDWEAVHQEYQPFIAAAESDETFYQLLNRMLWELNVSHVGVGPVDTWTSVEPAVWMNGETGMDLRLLNEQAVITRVEAGSPADEAGLLPGFIIQRIESTPVQKILQEEADALAPPYNDSSRIDQLTRSLLRRIYGDPGTCVSLAYLDENDQMIEKCIYRVERPRTGRMGNVLPPSYLEFESSRLENEFGYIRFNTFHPDLVPDFVAAIDELMDTRGIIIDLRGNPGGDPTMADELAAIFLEDQVLFGNFKTRSGTLARLVTGRNVYPGGLVVLIDELSFSGSEYFSSGMQKLGRAVIIGQPSPGGATAMNVAQLPNDAILGYPVAQLLTKDGDVLEGVGVLPDLIVTLDRSQLLNGIDAQLQAAIDTLNNDPP